MKLELNEMSNAETDESREYAKPSKAKALY